MTLREFKNHIEQFEKGTMFNNGISNPFSWRGSYDEVAFSIAEYPMSREDILAKIERAYTETFHGYKGGEYQYTDHTQINFEEAGSRDYSNGDYTASMISKLEDAPTYRTQEERLVKMAFKNPANP